MKHSHTFILTAIPNMNRIDIETVLEGFGSYTLTFLIDPRDGRIEPVMISFDVGGFGVMSFEGWTEAGSNILAMGSMRLTTEKGLYEVEYGRDWTLRKVIRHDPQYDYMSASTYILGQRVAELREGLVYETTYAHKRPVRRTKYSPWDYYLKCPPAVRSVIRGWV